MHQNQVGQNLLLVKKSLKEEIIEGDARFTVRDIARKKWHITINGSPYFDEAFQRPKYFC